MNPDPRLSRGAQTPAPEDFRIGVNVPKFPEGQWSKSHGPKSVVRGLPIEDMNHRALLRYGPLFWVPGSLIAVFLFTGCKRPDADRVVCGSRRGDRRKAVAPGSGLAPVDFEK